jgi:hypothetical protein
MSPSGEFNKQPKGLFNPGEPRLIALESSGILCLLLNDEIHRSLRFFVSQFKSLQRQNSTQDDASTLAEAILEANPGGVLL